MNLSKSIILNPRINTSIMVVFFILFSLYVLLFPVIIFDEIHSFKKYLILFLYLLPAIFLYIYLCKKKEIDHLFFSISLFISNVFILSVIGYWPVFSGYFARNPSNHHTDSNFHISIINSFKNAELPSTRLHPDVYTHYHFLAHIYDSMVFYVASIDSKLVYSFTLYPKFIAIASSISLISAFSAKKSWLFGVSVFILLMSYTANSWHAVGSNSQWIGTYLTLLLIPYFCRVLNKDITYKEMILLSFIGILVIYSKSSLYISLYSTLGLIILFKNGLNTKVILTGILFSSILLVFIYLQSTSLAITAGISEKSIYDFLGYKYFVIFMMLITLSLSIIMSVRNSIQYMAPAIIVLLLTILLGKNASTDTNDWFYIKFSAAYTVIFFIIVCSYNMAAYRHIFRLTPLLCGVVIFLFSSTSFDKEKWQHTLGEAYGVVDRNLIAREKYAYNIKKVWQSTIFKDGYQKSKSFIFINKGDWVKLLELSGFKKEDSYWRGVLYYQAAIDVPFVNAVPPNTTSRYLFSAYGKNSYWQDNYNYECKKGYAVIEIISIVKHTNRVIYC